MKEMNIMMLQLGKYMYKSYNVKFLNKTMTDWASDKQEKQWEPINSKTIQCSEMAFDENILLRLKRTNGI
jgi:hypothetical protein